MGAWGTGVFQDDLACEVRDQWRELVADGLSGEAATQSLVNANPEILRDTDSVPVFWIALAMTQWKAGRLEQLVKDRALETIDDGSSLALWQSDPGLLKKRRAVLAKARRQLDSVAPAATRIRKRFKDSCEWEVGELIAYRLLSGTFVIFRVIDYHTDRGGTSPIFELLDWSGDTIPPLEDLERVGIRIGKDSSDEPEWLRRLLPPNATKIEAGRTAERQLPKERIVRLRCKLAPVQPDGRGWVGGLWMYLDKTLDEYFNLR